MGMATRETILGAAVVVVASFGASMSRPLSERTKRLMSLIDDSALRSKVERLFQEDGALYGPPTADVLERVRFAVIKLALQGEQMFEIAAHLFRVDTRDLLVNAEFANDLDAHEQWSGAM